MKQEYAIEVLKRYKKSIESDFIKPEETEPVQAYSTAITALEKQVEKKPISEVEWDKFRDCERITRCGACSYEVGRWSKYCPECGQKIERGKE